jgi:hypothetical protein
MAFIRVEHPSLDGYAKTALTEAATASDTSLIVENIVGFSANEYLLLSGYGSSKSEIVRIDSAAPSGTTITLNSSNSTTHAHPVGATLQFIPFNQMEIEYSTDLETNFTSGAYTTLAAASDASTWTNLTTIDIDPTSDATTYNDVSLASRSYRTRFLNSSTAQYSPYSDPILPDGFEEYSAGAIIRKALGRTNQSVSQEDNALFNYEFLLDEITSCINEVHAERKRWSWNQEFEHTLSDVTAGKQSYVLPNNVDYDYSNRALFNVRVNDKANLLYIDKQTLDRKMRDVHTSQLAGALTSGSSTIVLDDTSDFGDSGTFVVITGTTKDTVTYSANDRSTNTLTLSAAATEVTTTHAIDTDVWENASFSNTVQYYTVYENNIHLWPLPDVNLASRTIEIDYYKRVIPVNSVNDYVLFPDPALVVHYLCMAISIRQRNYEDIDRYRALYQERLAKLVQNEVTGQRRRFILNLNTGGYPINSRTSRIGRAANEGQ